MKSNQLFIEINGSSNIYQYLNLTTIIQCNLCYLTTVKLKILVYYDLVKKMKNSF